MLTPWEIKSKEYLPPLIMVKMNIMGVLSLLKILLLNLKSVKNARKQEKKNIYVNPKLTYKIPQYKEGMKNCNSEEKYLRPTLYCNCRAPEVIALANELGAYKKSDLEFAQSAFEFAKRKIILQFVPLDDIPETLKRGTGTCVHKNSVFIALCRAAGLPARYKFYALTMLDEWMQTPLDNAPLMKKWYDVMGSFLLHGGAEVFIDGKWISADAGAEPERQAMAWLPITKLGEDAVGVWLFPIPGTIIKRESVPLGLGLPSRVLMKKLLPNSVVGLNIGVLKQIEEGRRIIEESGGEIPYDKMAREKRAKAMPKPSVEKKSNKIIFEE
jgi:hypothetical protein